VDLKKSMFGGGDPIYKREQIGGCCPGRRPLDHHPGERRMQMEDLGWFHFLQATYYVYVILRDGAKAVRWRFRNKDD
jgi:hypothetical protein